MEPIQNNPNADPQLSGDAAIVHQGARPIQLEAVLDINRRMQAEAGMLDAANTLVSQSGSELVVPTTEDELYIPGVAYDIATDIVEKNPDLLPAAIAWRWEMELRRGVVNFDPRDPSQYKTTGIGSYMKRIIPDRVLPDTEVFSHAAVPVYLPFEQKYPNNFDFTMAKPGQKLLSINVEGNGFNVFASNSPLAEVPHTLLVPQELRPQFLQRPDMEAVLKLQERYPSFHFVFSSMGGGAGVNHQHWHMMAGESQYPVQSRPISPLYEFNGTRIGHYPEYPTDCILIEKSGDVTMDLETAFIEHLQQNNIPHNLFVKGNRTWIAPRSHTETLLIPGKKYGAWETILGVCNTGTQEQYDFVDDTILEQALHTIQLPPAEKAELVQALISLV